MLGVKRRHMFWSGACVGQFSISPRQLSSLVGSGGREGGRGALILPLTPLWPAAAAAALVFGGWSEMRHYCDTD